MPRCSETGPLSHFQGEGAFDDEAGGPRKIFEDEIMAWRVGSACWVGVGGLFCCLQSSPLACVPLQKEWIAVGRGRGASEVEMGATWCWFGLRGGCVGGSYGGVWLGGVEQPVCPAGLGLGGQLGQVQARAPGGVV